MRRRDAGPMSADRPSPIARRRGMRSSAREARLRWPLQSWDRTTGLARPPDVRSRWQQSSELRQRPYVRPPRASPLQRLRLRLARGLVLGGWVPYSAERIAGRETPPRRQLQVPQPRRGGPSAGLFLQGFNGDLPRIPAARVRDSPYFGHRVKLCPQRVPNTNFKVYVR